MGFAYRVCNREHMFDSRQPPVRARARQVREYARSRVGVAESTL
jgi:hypothetical protein